PIEALYTRRSVSRCSHALLLRRLPPSVFFHDPATPEIYTLSLHDALPISWSRVQALRRRSPATRLWRGSPRWARTTRRMAARCRSEEHTSELQSQSNLVCRLLLEKKKIN